VGETTFKRGCAAAPSSPRRGLGGEKNAMRPARLPAFKNLTRAQPSDGVTRLPPAQGEPVRGGQVF
jgi:hypothetical protein